MDKPTYLISLFGWEGFWPLFLKDDYEEAKRIVEDVVKKQGVPEDTVGYCVTCFDRSDIALGDIFYQCKEDPSENPDWRKPGCSQWEWDSVPYHSRPREECTWWRSFVVDAKIDIEEK